MPTILFLVLMEAYSFSWLLTISSFEYLLFTDPVPISTCSITGSVNIYKSSLLYLSTLEVEVEEVACLQVVVVEEEVVAVMKVLPHQDLVVGRGPENYKPSNQDPNG